MATIEEEVQRYPRIIANVPSLDEVTRRDAERFMEYIEKRQATSDYLPRKDSYPPDMPSLRKSGLIRAANNLSASIWPQWVQHFGTEEKALERIEGAVVKEYSAAVSSIPYAVDPEQRVDWLPSLNATIEHSISEVEYEEIVKTHHAIGVTD